MALVLDASVTAAWILPDETNHEAERTLDLLASRAAYVPAIWWFEIRNLLVSAERRRRLDPQTSRLVLASLDAHNIVIDQTADEDAMFEIARTNGLSFYDAAYVELAERRRLPIATLDKAMKSAAVERGIPVM